MQLKRCVLQVIRAWGTLPDCREAASPDRPILQASRQQTSGPVTIRKGGYAELHVKHRLQGHLTVANAQHLNQLLTTASSNPVLPLDASTRGSTVEASQALPHCKHVHRNPQALRHVSPRTHTSPTRKERVAQELARLKHVRFRANF